MNNKTGWALLLSRSGRVEHWAAMVVQRLERKRRLNRSNAYSLSMSTYLMRLVITSILVERRVCLQSTDFSNFYPSVEALPSDRRKAARISKQTAGISEPLSKVWTKKSFSSIGSEFNHVRTVWQVGNPV